MKILVTGANGQLGQSLKQRIARSSHNFFFPSHQDLDICNKSDVERYILGHGIDLVINCAAYTQVDQAEDDPDTAFAVNATAVDNLAKVVESVGGWLIHISTDYVFGLQNHNTPITEQALTNPSGVYGESKLAGEKAIIESKVNHVIVRTSWLYSEYRTNFMRTMLRVLPARGLARVVFDQVGTPTYAGDLAGAILVIVEHIASNAQYQGGIYNYSNEGVCSWYDFAVTIADFAHIDCCIQPCRSCDYPTKAVRPSYSVLDKNLIKTTFGLTIPHWTASLRHCLEEVSNATI